MENKFVKLNSSADWSDYTFVFASVSVGNIAQLATDLLISSVSGGVKKAGYLISSLVRPLVGYDAFNVSSNDLSLSCELFESQSCKLVIMQQRAPLFKGKRQEFVDLLIEFIKQERFRESICLTSYHAYERLDSQLAGVQMRYLATKSATTPANWILLEKRLDHNQNYDDSTLSHFIPGGGIAQKFFKSSKESGINAYVLMVFAHEGFNIPEAFQLANYLNEWKDYVKSSSVSGPSSSSWRTPISWRHIHGQSLDLWTRSQIF